MTTTRRRFLVSFTREELVKVQALADQVRLSRSELLRRLVLGSHIPGPEDFAMAKAIQDMYRINADQARLGNLLKLALDVGDRDFTTPMITRIEDLIKEIRETQAAMIRLARETHALLHPRAGR